ncbi:PREDICTED: odorant receptor 22c-like [Cyphomyrmex costatus]|uniref:odorant receptor 22c-like n=1 Tax=Cyphomyrmex costatus TaxID=456900 RepID=UPI0008523A51|nr:PREDICTED: odorant receptor 22c-like [Cyphomyrmex costatus]
MSNSERATESDIPKKNTDYNLQINRWFLKAIGAWPQIDESSLVWKILILLQIFICSSIVASNMIPCLLYVLFEKKNIKLKLRAFVPLLHRIMGSIDYWVLLKRNGEIHKLIRHIEEDWCLIQELNDRKIMLQHAKFGRFVAIICGIMMQSGCILYSLGQLMQTITITIGNETFTSRPTACPTYSKIIDTRFSPVNEIALILQNLTMVIMTTSTVGACSLAAVFAIHACGQLNVLYAWLNELVENQTKRNDKAERKLAAIVEHHLRILSFISEVESIMNKISLAELIGCTMVMCFLGYYVIMEWETLDTVKITGYLFVYLSMGFNIFIFCYIGGIVTEQCKLVGEMAYMTDWYNLHHTTARGLILIIARSNNVIKITAGKIFHLSIATFGDVIKSSMVYLNILRTMTV